MSQSIIKTAIVVVEFALAAHVPIGSDPKIRDIQGGFSIEIIIQSDGIGGISRRKVGLGVFRCNAGLAECGRCIDGPVIAGVSFVVFIAGQRQAGG